MPPTTFLAPDSLSMTASSSSLSAGSSSLSWVRESGARLPEGRRVSCHEAHRAREEEEEEEEGVGSAAMASL